MTLVTYFKFCYPPILFDYYQEYKRRTVKRTIQQLQEKKQEFNMLNINTLIITVKKLSLGCNFLESGTSYYQFRSHETWKLAVEIALKTHKGTPVKNRIRFWLVIFLAGSFFLLNQSRVISIAQ